MNTNTKSWTMPDYHYNRLLDLYDQTSHEGLDIKKVSFPWRIGQQIYTEFCLSDGHRNDRQPSDTT